MTETPPLRIGIVGTGAVADLHARAYRNIGFAVTACTDINPDAARRFSTIHHVPIAASTADLAARVDVDVVDICTLPGVRLELVEAAARHGKAIQIQKPLATTVAIGEAIVATARRAGVILGVVSQHRFDDASQFVVRALRAGRLGRLLECDAYVKWYRTPEYYARPAKGTWDGEGGGALINQAIHHVDLLRWFAGDVTAVQAQWQLGARHRIEGEDVVNALVRYASGATGVIQASTAFAPGASERIELHGTKGTAIITGDQLTHWQVDDDEGEAPPLSVNVASGASDPMAISLTPFERQFQDFGNAVRDRTQPLVSGDEALATLRLVDAIYRACRTGLITAPVPAPASEAGLRS